MLAQAGALPRQQRRLHAHDGEHAAAQVADGNAGPHLLPRPHAGDGHAAAESLHDLVKGRTLVMGAVLAEAGDRAGDDARVDRGQGVVVDLQPPGDAGGEVVQHHIGVAHQFVEEAQPGLGLEVDGHRTLVAVQGEEVGAHAVQGMLRVVLKQAAGALALAGRLHLHRIAAEVGQDHAGVGAGQHVRQVDQADAGQGLAGGASSGALRRSGGLG